MKESTEITELMADVREQVLYMKELGVELMNTTESTSLSADLGNMPEEISNGEYSQATVVEVVRPPEKQDAPTTRLSRLLDLPSLSNRTMVRSDNLKIELIEPPKQRHTEAALADALFDVGPALPDSGETIEHIRADIGDCTRCELHSGRTQVVHSSGNFQADLMFVGEAPGADEDAQGFPFVGRAGQLLTKIIESIGFKREDVFIGNINRCRPPANRQPTIQEAHTCRPFLLREIAVVKPKVIVVLGNTALHNLLDTKVGITKIRGQFQDYFGVKVMPTFHPAFLLRDPSKKREVWEDMKKVRDYLKDEG